MLEPTQHDLGKYTMNNSNSADRLSNPVALELSKLIEQTGFRVYRSTAVKAVLKAGQSFTGIARPKGYRQMRLKQCFWNAGRLALEHRGIYVEGFVLTPGSWSIPHAWLTLDGIHAIDVTLKDAPAYHYFGIAFSHEVLCEWMIRRRCTGLLHWDDEQTSAVLEYARLHPPSFHDSEPQ